jgi:glucokinase
MTDSEKTCLAVDVGGTNIRMGLVRADGQVLAGRGLATDSARGPEKVIADLIDNLKAIAAAAPPAGKPQALAIGLPGWIDQARGILIKAPNMPGWSDIPLASLMREALGLPVYLENDTNLYALGEWRRGAGRGLNNLLVITLGTGVGGGLILDGRLWYGSFASAVEIGHMPITLAGGAVCGCGRRGCLETVASATGMIRLGRDWLRKKKPTAYKGNPADLTPKIMRDLARAGDPMSLAVFKMAGEALGLILAGIFNLLGLEGVVVGGGAAGAFEFLQPPLRRILDERILIAGPAGIKLLPGELGDEAALAGAPALVRALSPTRV